MKLNKLLLSLSLAGLAFGQASGQESKASRRIGDGPAQSVRTLGADFENSLPSQVDVAVGTRGDDTAVKLASTRSISDASYTGHRVLSDGGPSYAQSMDMGVLAPTTTASCSSACTTGSCYTDCGGSAGGLAGKGKGNVWFSGEVLLWFTENAPSPTVASTSPQGVTPVLGNGQTVSAFGGDDGISHGLIPGFRTELGLWLDSCQKVGVLGRAYGFTEYEDYQNTSDGSVSLGIPFFNLDPNVVAEDAYLVGFDLANGTPVAEGQVWARADLDLLGIEGSTRILLTEGRNSRFDLLGGYTYNRMTSSLGVRSQSTNLFTGDLIQDGTVFDTLDQFSTENEFHGGHLGLLSSVTRKGLTLSTLSKISFGNFRNSGVIEGYTRETFGANSTVSSGGILTRPSNIGTLAAENNFGFISELGMKAGFQLNDRLQATVGYTLMYWSSIAMAGDQVDRHVDPSAAVARPAANLVTDGFWAQGVDLGFIYSY